MRYINSGMVISLLLLSSFFGVILINLIHPPDFELFSKTVKPVEIENYFSSFPFYLLVSVWLVPVVLFWGLKKVLSIFYKDLDLKAKMFFFEALIAGAIIYGASKLNYAITLEIDYFIQEILPIH